MRGLALVEISCSSQEVPHPSEQSLRTLGRCSVLVVAVVTLACFFWGSRPMKPYTEPRPSTVVECEGARADAVVSIQFGTRTIGLPCSSHLESAKREERTYVAISMYLLFDGGAGRVQALSNDSLPSGPDTTPLRGEIATWSDVSSVLERQPSNDFKQLWASPDGGLLIGEVPRRPELEIRVRADIDAVEREARILCHAYRRDDLAALIQALHSPSEAIPKSSCRIDFAVKGQLTAWFVAPNGRAVLAAPAQVISSLDVFLANINAIN